MAPTKQIEKKKQDDAWALTPLEQEVGAKLHGMIEKAPNVSVAQGEDPREAMLAIVSRILDADTPEKANAVFGGNTTSTRDLAKTGTDVELRTMTLRPSDFPDPDTEQRGWYGQFEAINLETGEAILISTSSKAVMAAFVAADAHGFTPAQGRFVLGEETDRGFRPIHFEHAV